MTGGSEENNSFWPGYVDAISNLVLSLLFLVAILTISVFMFAMELGRRQAAVAHGSHELAARKSVVARQVETPTVAAAEQKSALESEIKSLKKELKALKQSSEKHSVALAEDSGHRASETPRKYLTASEKAHAPEKDIAKIQPRPSGIVIVFAPDAVALTGAEIGKAKEVLSAFKSAGGAKVEVLIPTGFTEVKRLAFYRAMSVRNLLIELGIPSEKIEVSLPEVNSGGDSARVVVRSR